MEEQIKKFLEEECEKYKHIIWTEETGDIVHRMVKEIHEYLYINRKEVYKISYEEFKKIENYAVELSKQFDDQSNAHLFWYSGVTYGFEALPSDK
jgi:uncharacterized protein YutE (UPF0331/DUF86 family)